jgi:tetratricopeptide (TPR) repeat protein
MRARAVLALLLGVVLATATLAGDDRPSRSLDELERQLTSAPDDIQAANAYRRSVIETGVYDRALGFFETLVAANPKAANAYLNYGFALVDKIPAAGSITQVILANSALTQFTASIELRPTWIAYYTRGASYLFWPKIFNRAALGVADLEKALAIQRSEPKRTYHVRTFVALGDGYWKIDDLPRARATWQKGLDEFPGHAPLVSRLHADAALLARIIDEAFDPTRRVDTDLSELWSAQ